MDGSSTHSTRTLTIPLTGNPNLLLVAGGSNGNLDGPTVEKDVVRSQVRIFNIDDLLAADAPFDYGSAEVLGWGLRNSVGFAEDPSTGYIVSFSTHPDFWLNILHHLNDAESWRRWADFKLSGPSRTQSTTSSATARTSTTPTPAKSSTSTASPMILQALCSEPTTATQAASPFMTLPSCGTTPVVQRLDSRWRRPRMERITLGLRTRSVKRRKPLGSHLGRILRRWM